MFTFKQSTGELTDGTGAVVGVGYSGNGPGLNNPSLQSVADTGPLPEGLWHIGDAFTHPHLGPIVMALTPDLTTDTFGRSLFFIHGKSPEDLIEHADVSSHGCLVFGPAVRQTIAGSEDQLLESVA